MSVWKYLIPTAAFDVEMPVGARIVHVDKPHGGAPAFWAIVDPIAPVETRRFRVYGTGHNIGEGTYLGTFEPEHGLIFHLFELTGPS
jgi:hypothetical protein